MQMGNMIWDKVTSLLTLSMFKSSYQKLWKNFEKSSHKFMQIF